MKTVHNNLSVVLLDDDYASLLQLKQLIIGNNLAKVDAFFTSPETFLKNSSVLNFDILILDCDMPGINGKEIIDIVGCERCIINTGSKDKYEEAINCHPIDILIKPASEADLIRTFEKVKKVLSSSNGPKEYYLFKTLDQTDKINIRIQDIVYIFTHNNSRRKTMLIRNGIEHTISDYTMEELVEIAPHLLRPNQSELVGIDIIQSKGYDYLYLTVGDANSKPKWVTIGRSFIKEFNLQYNSL